MAYIPRSSFIPKEASGAIPMQVRKKRTVHIFGLLSMFVLVTSLVAAGGTYAYVGVLEKQLEAVKSDLQGKAAEDHQKRIDELRAYDQKLKLAGDLLNAHLSPVLVFETLEDITKETVQFNGLQFSYDPWFEASVTLTGSTEELASVALQKMEVYKEGVFSEFVVQDISTSGDEDTVATPDSPGVGFSIKGTFMDKALAYTGLNMSTTSTVAPGLASTTSLPVATATPNGVSTQ